MKKLSVLFILLCLPTFAFADGCTLEFKADVGRLTQMIGVIRAWQHPHRLSGVYTLINDGNRTREGLEYPHLYDLTKVNGVDIGKIDWVNDNPFIDCVLFSCDKAYSGNYIAYKCKKPKSKGIQVGQDADGYPYYDKCIEPDNEDYKDETVDDVVQNDDDKKTGAADDNDKKSHQITPSTFDFAELDKMLNLYFSKDSVWTDTNGGFNTVRLVSDSVAGIVLGTIGGVITSKIIKKNQIENGFDNLKCTVAGQDVARYGDDFDVTIEQ